MCAWSLQVPSWFLCTPARGLEDIWYLRDGTKAIVVPLCLCVFDRFRTEVLSHWQLQKACAHRRVRRGDVCSPTSYTLASDDLS
ncbi:hypothetical protein GGF50DRAFT_101529, partial [Schizophyllum commune]